MKTSTPTNNRNILSRVSFLAGITASTSFFLTFMITGILNGSQSTPLWHGFLLYSFYFILAFSLIAPLAAIPSGIIALRQIRQSGEEGTSHAMAGIVLGIVGLVPLVLMLGG